MMWDWCLIDQRALHERLLYDIYVETLQKKEVSVQTFKASLLLELSHIRNQSC